MWTKFLDEWSELHVEKIGKNLGERSEQKIDPKINRGPPLLIGNTCVKYHDCMSKGNRVTIRTQSIIQTWNIHIYLQWYQYPSLNSAKMFQFNSRWTVNKKFGSSAESHAQWLIHQMKLSARYCDNFEFKTFLEELCWKHCKYKEWVSSRLTRFVCSALRFIPHEPRKKDTHSLNIPFTFDLLTPSYHHCMSKRNGVTVWKRYKV